MDRATRNTEVLDRGVPWVSFGLVCLCVMGFAYATLQAVEIDAVAESELAVAEAHFRAHPYLELPAILETRIDKSTAQQLGREYEMQRQRRDSLPRPARLVAQEQLALERMTRQVEAKLESRPEYAFGLVATERNPITYLSHLVLHGGAAHLVVCMLLLIAVGRSLEAAWGGAVMLCAVCALTFASGALFLAQQPEQTQPLIGTSGLLAGLLAAFAVRFFGSQRSVAYWPLLVLGTIALWLPPWLGADWSVARSVGAPAPLVGGWNPSMWALVGGLAAGVSVALAVRMLGLERLIEREEVATELRRDGRDSEVELALQERNSGKLDQAFRRLGEHLRREPDNVAAALAFWDVCDSLDRHQAAAPYLLRAVRECIRRGESQSALDGWLELTRVELDAGAEPALLLRMAALLRDAGHDAVAVRALKHALERVDPASGPAVASRVARAAVALDPETAASAAWQALGSIELDLEERQALEDLLAPLVSGATLGVGTPTAQASSLPSATRGNAGLGHDDDTVPDELEMFCFDRTLERVNAVPLKFDETGLLIAAGKARKRVAYSRIDAVAVAAIEGLASKSVIVVDLLLNWESALDEPLKAIRLRADAFDPRSLIVGETDPATALRALCVRLWQETRATPLPDEPSVRGEPFAAFKSLAEYQRDVLMVETEEG